MIRLLEDYGGEGLLSTHYSRVIRSHLSAYGTGYDFCLFYEICERKRVGIISVFNGAVTVDLTEKSKPSPGVRREIMEFVSFQSPYSVELPSVLVHKSGFPGYSAAVRRFFEIPPGEEHEELMNPDFDSAFKALNLPEDSYPLWLTDTAKRVNMGLSELLGYKSSILSVRFKEKNLAFISDLATPPKDRGHGQATVLLRKAAKKLAEEGFISYLAAKPELWQFYEKAGCRTVGEDVIYIKKEN